MAYRGIKKVHLGMIDPETEQLITGENGLSEDGIYTVGKKDWGSKSANISNLAPGTQEVYGDNELQAILKGDAKPQVALEFNALDPVIEARLLNKIPDGNGGFKKDPEHEYNVALMIDFDDPKTVGRVAHFCFPNGNVVDGAGVNGETETGNPTLIGDTMTFNALASTALGGEPYRKFISDAADFDEAKMLSIAFGGYTKKA